MFLQATVPALVKKMKEEEITQEQREQVNCCSLHALLASLLACLA